MIILLCDLENDSLITMSFVSLGNLKNADTDYFIFISIELISFRKALQLLSTSLSISPPKFKLAAILAPVKNGDFQLSEILIPLCFICKTISIRSFSAHSTLPNNFNKLFSSSLNNFEGKSLKAASLATYPGVAEMRMHVERE